ncbi:MFS transporter [Acinetobacter stercoris]|uniref:Inner membrane transport protein YnfM n=1 Tax=Acinetobacter stercoris TaxID=2126983 RepID=A0A2U3MZU8_9GAMM|nr:MFS transporter [Acinetobacter stercoris]SPL70819.1 Inner membrane transport protein YnfM [Acinetobacter stercoris]
MSNLSNINRNVPLSKSFIFIMAVTCGMCAGSNFYNQPLVYAFSESLDVRPDQAALTIVISQLSYAIGLFLLVPLGDLFEKRQFICLLMCATGIAQLAIAVSGNLYTLYLFTAVATFFSIAAQVLIPFSSTMVSEKQSAQVVGMLMSGLLMGILFARTFAGLISTLWSWHYVYAISGGLVIGLASIMWFKLPVSTVNTQLNIKEIYTSLFRLMRNEPHLIRRGWIGCFTFAMVTLLFTSMTFILANAPYHFNEFQIGLFGIVGIAGVFSTRWAGFQISQNNEQKVATVSISIIIGSWLLIYFAQISLYIYLCGVIFAYFALSALHVLNQNLVYRISLAARSRINSIYMTMYFTGGVIGSMSSVYAWKHWGWTACVIIGFCFAAIVALLNIYDHRQMKNS